jgi:predicted  nucleic acid-binding Zn-ribbon protein
LIDPPRLPLPLLSGQAKDLLHLKKQLDKHLDEARARSDQAHKLLRAVQGRYNEWQELRHEMEGRMHEIETQNSTQM